ncbi:MAG: UvrB/UvrC motif-containing protein [Patescibacteria group bacterium]|nr:UvrB/UvrC motif-containing protein [Patescibacteria group bacterium]
MNNDYMGSFKYIKIDNIVSIPNTPGVYAFKGAKEVIYIGKAARLKARIQNHFKQPSYRDNLFMEQIKKVGYIETDSEIEALLLESQLIKKRTPKYNVMWKDDKNYFFVAITKETLPRVFITHQPKDKKITYIGPFVEGKPLKRTLRNLRKAFPYLTTKTHTVRPCQYCHLNLCPGNKPEITIYKKDIKNLTAVLKGKRTSVIRSLRKEMKESSKAHEYEKAGRLRDQIEDLEAIIAHSRILTPYYQRTPIDWDKTNKNLQKLLNTRKNIRRVEAYDISNIQGKEATGSMVVFENGKPAKSEYRKFKIHITGTPNDFAMMEELILRRLKHKEWKYPELMIIDGGKGQLSSTLKSMTKEQQKRIKVGAIAKKNNELFFPQKREATLLKDLSSGISNLILHIRDEAHRFAITYHRKLHRVDLLSKHR